MVKGRKDEQEKYIKEINKGMNMQAVSHLDRDKETYADRERDRQKDIHREIQR